MPRYLALDYLSLAVSHHRCQLETMMVAPPHHMEIVDSYVHKGQFPNTSYWTPWREQELSVDVIISCSSETVGEELRALSGPHHQHCQDGLEELSSDGDEVGSEVDLFSQDIASALREMEDKEGVVGGRGRDGSREDYPVETLAHWETLTAQVSCSECVVECPESPNRVDTLLSLVPTVGDLSRRLKPKLIQDPFVDQAGQAYSYEEMFRSEQTLDSVTGDSVCEEVDKEDFPSESLAGCLDVEDIDPLFALTVPNEGEPLSLLDDNPELPLPDHSLEQSLVVKELVDDTKDLTTLMEELSKKSLSKKPNEEDRIPELSPVTEETNCVPLDFHTLNDRDVGGESDDSGIGYAHLESPLLPPSHLHTLSPLISRQLALLEPIPMSPEGKIMFLSPGSGQRLEKELWEREAMFDTVLTNTLPYPDAAGVVEALGSVTDVLSELYSLLGVTELKTSGDHELELPWDPLAESCHEMELAENSLIARHPYYPATPPLSESRGSTEMEGFSREGLVEDESIELPLEASQDEEMHASQLLSSHQPTVTQAHPHTITKSTPTPSRIHPKDAAWNLLLQSTSAKTQQLPPTHKMSDLYKPLHSAFNRLHPTQTGKRNLTTLERGVAPIERDCGGGLDAFMMLRSSVGVAGGCGVKRVCGEETGDGPSRKKALENAGNDTLLTLDLIDRTATSSFLDVCLSGPYLSTVLKLEELATELCGDLSSLGVRVPSSRGQRSREIPADSIKFLLKQQQKVLEGSHGPASTELCLRSCQLVASLYVTVTLLTALFHCSLGVALVKLTTLCDKYHDLLGGREDSVKRELLSLQLSQGSAHPKLLELVRLVTVWRNQERSTRREKAVIVVESEFPTLSVEILDMLQSIPGLKSCVFSLVPDSAPSQLYLKAVQDRFHLYDCLVVPVSSLAGQESFPWEKVTLLVEYEQLGRALFDYTTQHKGYHGVTVADRLNLKRYVTLRTVEDISTSREPSRGTGLDDLCSVQFTLIASERVVANTQLLQLLETRHNTLIVERDFQSLQRRFKSKYFSYSDILLDHSTGVVLRPVSMLSSDQGVTTLASTVTRLSFQLQTCWVLLYTEGVQSYPYGGSIPANLARLHALVAHYCPKLDQYTVRVVTTAGVEQVASWVRRLTETTHNCEQGVESGEWVKRDWVETEISKGEMVLLTFPCLNSFSALGILKKASLGDLFQMNTQQLQSMFPWLPEKIAKIFHSMCHLGVIPEVGDADSAFLPSLPSLEAGTNDTAAAPPLTSSYFTAQPEVQQLSQESTTGTSNSPTYLSNLGDTTTNAFSTASSLECSIQAAKDQETITLDDSLEDGESVFRFSTEKQGSDVIDLTSPQNNVLTEQLVSSSQDIFSDSLVSKSSLDSTHHFNFSFERDERHSSRGSTGLYSSYFKPRKPEPSFEASSNLVTADSSSTSMRLLSSSKRAGKTPSQKQIRESVLDGISGSTSSRTGSTSGFSSHLGYISSSAARSRSNNQTRTPVKSLDLGFEGQNPQRVLLQCNDRTVGSNGQGALNHALFRESLSNRSFLRNDSLHVVPSHTSVSPPCRDTSLFDSPERSLTLSPAKKRRLSCQRDPSRTDGQTKLILF